MKNPLDWHFGSKDWNEYYGVGKGNRAKGDRAKRAGAALKAALTKKGEAVFLEKQRKEWEAAGGKLSKAQRAEDQAMARILPGGRAFALKIARPDGGLFGPGDVEAFRRSGWEVHPAGTAPAKTGSALPAFPEVNPGGTGRDVMVRILGPELAARAVVIAGPDALTEDQVHAWRRAGYDVSPAPKAMRERAAVAANPSGAEQRKVYETLKKAKSPVSAEGLAALSKVAPGEALAALQRLEALGLAHVAGADLFGALWAPGARERGLFEGIEAAQQPALAFNPNDHYDRGSITAWLAETLMDRGWKVEGYHADDSDSMTDYFSPAYWHGFAVHPELPGLVLVVDDRSPGQEIHRREFFEETCKACGGTGRRKGIHPTGTECPACDGKGTRRNFRWVQVGVAPHRHATPKGSLWHLEKDGELVAKGRAGFSWKGASCQPERNQEGLQQLLGRILAAVEKATPKAKPARKAASRKEPSQAPARAPRQEPKAALPPASIQRGLFGGQQAQAVHAPRLGINPGQKRPRAATGPAPKKDAGSMRKVHRFNPTDAAEVAKVWKLWTGAEVGQVLKLTLDLPERAELPGTVALLGRVSRLIGPDGSYREFKASEAPFMVTDGKMRRLWLLGVKPQAFDTAVSIIAYVTRKPKFGDRGTVEYIHAFKGSAKARMSGHAGEITGTFRLTGRGIEG
jgi:hypothetical protein